MQPTHMQAQKVLADLAFPASLAELTEFAARHGGDRELLTDLRQLPDRVYRDTNDVGSAFAEVTGR